MARQVCVIGLGQFGMHLSRALVKLGCEVLAIDVNEVRVEQIRDDVHRALIGDARNFAMLSGVLTASVREAVICLGESNVEPSILCALHLRKIGIPIIRSTATTDDHARILLAVGATEAIFAEREAADRLGRRIANPDIRDVFPLADDYRIMEIDVPKKTVGKSLAELDLRSRYDLLVLAYRNPTEEHFHFLPLADKRIQPAETLMVLGRELDLVRFASQG